jgi:hypothetical protein
MTNQPAQAALVRAAASFVRDTYSGEWADDAAATLETDADLIERGEPCSLLRLAEAMQPAAVSAAVTPPTQTALRDWIRRAICEAEGFAWDTDMLEPDEYGEVADAVLAVLYREWPWLRAEAEDAAPTADQAAVLADDEGDELVCVDQCGSCDACGMEPFGTPAEGWRQAAHFLRRTARESSDRQGALHGARLIEAELRRLADETQQQPTACPQCGDTGACNGGPCALTSPAAPVPEPPVHGESVAHLASLHDDEQEQSETETLRTPAAGRAPTELRVRVLREILNRLDGSRSDGDSATQDVGASTVRAVLADILADMQPAAGEQQDGAEA